VLDNLGTMLFATASSGLSGFNTARVVNESSGVIRKTVGSSTATATTSAISAPVENDGKVESVAALGNITLQSGSGGTSTGTYGSASAAGLVQLTGSAVHTLGDGARLLDGAVIVDFIGRYETLATDLAYVGDRLGLPLALPHLNRSAHAHYRDYYTDETRAIVAARFARDIERFGYTF